MNECGSVVSWLTGVCSSVVHNPDKIKKYFETGDRREDEPMKEWCRRTPIVVRNDAKRIMHRLDPVKIFYEMHQVAKAICITDPKGNTIGIRPGVLKRFCSGKFHRERGWAIGLVLRSGGEMFDTLEELTVMARKAKKLTPRQKRILVHATGLALLNIPRVNPDTWSGMKPYWKLDWQGLKLKPISESYQSGACFVGVEIESRGRLVFKAHIRFNQIGPKSFGCRVEKDLPGEWDKLFDCK